MQINAQATFLSFNENDFLKLLGRHGKGGVRGYNRSWGVSSAGSSTNHSSSRKNCCFRVLTVYDRVIFVHTPGNWKLCNSELTRNYCKRDRKSIYWQDAQLLLIKASFTQFVYGYVSIQYPDLQLSKNKVATFETQVK